MEQQVHILVVEGVSGDFVKMMNVLQDIFSNSGITLAFGPKSTWQILEKQNFDLIFVNENLINPADVGYGPTLLLQMKSDQIPGKKVLLYSSERKNIPDIAGVLYLEKGSFFSGKEKEVLKNFFSE